MQPTWYIGETVVENVNVGVIISDPFLNLKLDKANKLADDPELTIKPNFFPKTLEIFFSNSFTEGPSIKLIDFFFRTSIVAAISSFPYTAFP